MYTLKIGKRTYASFDSMVTRAETLLKLLKEQGAGRFSAEDDEELSALEAFSLEAVPQLNMLATALDLEEGWPANRPRSKEERAAQANKLAGGLASGLLGFRCLPPTPEKQDAATASWPGANHPNYGCGLNRCWVVLATNLGNFAVEVMTDSGDWLTLRVHTPAGIRVKLEDKSKLTHRMFYPNENELREEVATGGIELTKY